MSWTSAIIMIIKMYQLLGFITVLGIVSLATSESTNKLNTSKVATPSPLPGISAVENETACPTWMYRDNSSSQCKCGVDYYYIVKCEEMIGWVYIIDSYRMTYDEKSKEEMVGASPYYGNYSTPGDIYDVYHPVPMNKSRLNEAMCGRYNRKGGLCGECKDGYSPLVYSYNIHCKKCSESESKSNIVKFICVAIIPLTVFYVIIVVFKFNANSPKVHGFILFAQVVSTPVIMRLLLTNSYKLNDSIPAIKTIATLYGMWNLDFFRTLYPDMCLKVTTLQALALDYVIAFYPITLMLLTLALFKLHSEGCRIVLWLWHPMDRCLSMFKKEWTEKASMIDVFATFLLLSYGRIMSVSFNLLIYTRIVNSRGELVGRYLYYDTSYEFLGKEHLPYGAIALLVFIIFNVLPLALLFLYPMKCFQKCLNHFKLSFIALHTFVDSFAGCYKDGTEPGVPDCRYFAGLFLLIRFLDYIIYEATQTTYCFGPGSVITTGILLLYAIIQPYKHKYKTSNKITVAMLAMLAITMVNAASVSVAFYKMHRAVTFSVVLFGIMISLPQLYIILVAIKWTGVHKFIKQKIKKVQGQEECEESLLSATSRERYRSLHSAA